MDYLAVHNVSKSFKKRLPVLVFAKGKVPLGSITKALANCSFRIQRGETVGLVGENGSGKSTLLRIMAGIMKPDEGRVALSTEAFYVNGLGQEILPKLTVTENIFYLGGLMGVPRVAIRAYRDKIMELSGLSDSAQVHVYRLSPGMRARLKLTVFFQCLEHHNSEILLLDEIFVSGIDSNFQNQLKQKIHSLKEKGVTIIMVSHHADMLTELCGRFIQLRKGEVCFDGEARHFNYSK